jgi:hypothetical protein
MRALQRRLVEGGALQRQRVLLMLQPPQAAVRWHVSQQQQH